MAEAPRKLSTESPKINGAKRGPGRPPKERMSQDGAEDEVFTEGETEGMN